jgi:type II secretory pathway component GspD/PulD (secretin)
MNTRQIMLSAAAVLSVGALWGAGAMTSDAKEMIRKSDLSRQETVFRGDLLVREGHKLFLEKNYFGARDKYMEAIKLFQRYPSRFFQDKVDFCKKEIAACYYAKAKDAADRSDQMALASDFDEAIKVCKEAMQYCPEQADELRDRIRLYEKRRDSLVQRSAFTTERLVPDKEAQDYQIQILLEQARRLAAVNDNSGAILKYNEILLIDPYNADATQGRRGIARRMAKMGNERYVNTHRRAMAEVEWKYALPILQEATGSSENVVNSAVAKTEEVRTSFIQPKLERIKIKDLAIDNKPISVAVNYLQEQSRKNDPDKDSLSKGVNIIYIGDVRNVDESPEERKKRDEERTKRLEERRKKQEEKRKNNENADNEEEEESSDEQGKDPLADEPRVTLAANSERTLMQALTMLCQSATPKLNMQIDDYAVVLTPADVTLSNMMLRSYPVTLSANLEKGNPEEISKTIQDTLSVKADGKTLFPKGASLYYNPDTKRVSVTNTRENHRIIQTLLDEDFRPRDTTMVQVMVKLVDINQNDLDELAFNWQLAVNSSKPRVQPNGKLSSSMIMDANNPLLRYYNGAGDRVGGDIAGSLMSFVWQNDKGTRVVASMFALNQADSADVLMSPRITVKEGTEGTINMIEVHNFPDSEWNDIDLPESDNAHFYATAQPDLSEETELGVAFKVRPTVNGNLITAEINVSFKTLAGWSEYDTRQFDKEGNVDDGNYYRMPILNTPVINTQITARDGETIIAGGVVSDETTSVNDKIPILGDLPFVGRLFKSKGSKSSKRNLLVFVTFRLVKPDGTPVTPRHQQGGLFPQGHPRFSSGL